MPECWATLVGECWCVRQRATRKGCRLALRSVCRAPHAAFDRKRRWRKYDAQDFVLELKHNYKSTVGWEKTIEHQYEEDTA